MTRPAFLVFVSARALAAAAALLALSAVLVSCGDASEDIGPNVLSSASGSPSSSASPILLTATPVATAESGGLAPDGCTSGELAYIDPDNRFAVCYRSDINVITTKDETALGTAVTIQYPLTDHNGVSVTIGWEETPAYTPCVEMMDVVKNRHMENMVVSGTTVEACVQDRYDVSDPSRYLGTSIDFAIQRKSGAPILVLAGYAGESATRSGLAAKAVATRIVSSIRVN